MMNKTSKVKMNFDEQKLSSETKERLINNLSQFKNKGVMNKNIQLQKQVDEQKQQTQKKV